MSIGREIIISVNDHRGNKSVVGLARVSIDSLARHQVALQVVLPEETLSAHLTHMTTHFRVHAVGVRTQVRAIEETLMANVTMHFISPKVQPFVLQEPGTREERFPAYVARFVRRQLRLDAAGDVRDVRLVIVVDAPAHARERAVLVVETRLATHGKVERLRQCCVGEASRDFI